MLMPIVPILDFSVSLQLERLNTESFYGKILPSWNQDRRPKVRNKIVSLNEKT